MGKQRIILHAHCRNCAPQKPRSKSMSDWARIECGVTDTGFQVWCKRCDMEVAHFTPGGLQHLMEKFPSAEGCECCPGGKHVGAS